MFRGTKESRNRGMLIKSKDRNRDIFHLLLSWPMNQAEFSTLTIQNVINEQLTLKLISSQLQSSTTFQSVWFVVCEVYIKLQI